MLQRQVLRKYFVFLIIHLRFDKEGVNNLVTEADHAAEKAIIDVIMPSFPITRYLVKNQEKSKTDLIINGSSTRSMVQ